MSRAVRAQSSRLLPFRDCDCLLGDEDNFGMEERSGYARGDGDEFDLAAEDFDVAGAGEVGEVYGASAADAGGGEFVGSDAGKLWQELTGVDEEGIDCVGLHHVRIGAGRIIVIVVVKR